MFYLAALFVYFIDIYNKYLIFMGILAGSLFLYSILLMLGWIFKNMDHDGQDEAQEYKRKFINSLKSKLFITVLSLAILSPSVKTIYISSSLILEQQAINKAENSELLQKTYKVLDLQMNKYLDEMLAVKDEKSDTKKESK